MNKHPQDQQYYRVVRRIKLAIYALLALTALFYIGKWWVKVPRLVDPLPVYAQAEGAESLRFMILGDTGSGDRNQYAVAQAMEQKCQEQALDGIIMLGDNFYMVGVSGVDDSQWESKVMTPYGRGCLESVPIYAILGNHDYKGDIEAQIRPPSPDDKWFMPHRFYQVTFGKLLNLIVTDTNTFDVCGDPGSCMIDFLAEALEGSQPKTYPWTFVASHHPIVSSSAKYRKKLPVGWFLQKMICGKVTALLSGHSHHLERMEMPDCGMDLIVSGGGGGELTPIIPDKENSQFATSTFGYLVLDVTATTLRYEFFDINNKSLYVHTVKAGD